MHAVRFADFKTYVRAVELLQKVGGTYQGVGTSQNRYVLVNDEQYNALIGAKLIKVNSYQSAEVLKGDPIL